MTAAPYHVEKAAKKAAAEPQDGMGALASFPSALRDSPATTNPFTKEGSGALADDRATRWLAPGCALRLYTQKSSGAVTRTAGHGPLAPAAALHANTHKTGETRGGPGTVSLQRRQREG